jgi:hypothetical protein
MPNIFIKKKKKKKKKRLKMKKINNSLIKEIIIGQKSLLLK